MPSPQDAAPFDYEKDIPVGYYDEIFRRHTGIQSKWHHLKFQRVREEFLPSCIHVDVACGPGTFMGTLPATIRSTGVDIAETQIAYAQRQYAAAQRQFRTMKPANLPFADNSSDIVTSIELIEHIAEEEALGLLRECRRILKPGGKVAITTPNYGFLWPLIEHGLNRFGKVSYKDQHITRYTPQRLRSLLGRAGFRSIQVETCLWIAPFAAALSWKFADWVDRHEPRFVTSKIGHLLIGTALKE